MNRPLPFISLRDATFRLGDRLVFRNTSWSFRRGEHWAILGPNGSGKSLFADAIRGRLPLVHGELRYGLRPPPGLSAEETFGHVSFEERKGSIGQTVVQSRWNSSEMDGTLSVRQFLSYESVMEVNPFEVTTRHTQARRLFERRFRRAISLLGLSPFLEHSLLSLSNGETQRVQLARALCFPLKLLILDEPFIGLDLATREHFQRALEQLMTTAVRVLLVTTRPQDLPRHITHVLRLEDCQVVAAGPRAELLRFTKVATTERKSARGMAGQLHAPRVKPPRRAREESSHLLRNALKAELVELRNVTVQYGATTVLNGFNWTVRSGESWALLGPNGSGKTTLLSLILGDNPQAYRNHVVVFGRRPGNGVSIWEVKKHVGWVSPELHLHFDAAATCLETVVSGFRESIGVFAPATAGQRVAARQWLARFGLLELAREPLFALSAGLQRMVLLARALVKKPRLLILDEPCQGLDDAHRDLFVTTIDSLIRDNAATVIYVTHRLEEIPSSIHRVLRLSRGKAAFSAGSSRSMR